MSGDEIAAHFEPLRWSDEQVDFIQDLLNKAKQVNDKTREHANSWIGVSTGKIFCPENLHTPLRVDDYKLLFVGSRLLPNILNYLINILPQFLYPYIVAYLQDLSTEEKVLTINDLYDLILELSSEG